MASWRIAARIGPLADLYQRKAFNRTGLCLLHLFLQHVSAFVVFVMSLMLLTVNRLIISPGRKAWVYWESFWVPGTCSWCCFADHLEILRKKQVALLSHKCACAEGELGQVKPESFQCAPQIFVFKGLTDELSIMRRLSMSLSTGQVGFKVTRLTLLLFFFYLRSGGHGTRSLCRSSQRGRRILHARLLVMLFCDFSLAQDVIACWNVFFFGSAWIHWTGPWSAWV